jgi:phage tail sheath protein FI
MALFQAGSLSMEGVKAAQLAMIAHCENMKDRFAILDCPPGLNPQQMKDWRMNTAGYDTKYGAVYYPWIKVGNPLGGEPITIPPSGYMAGIYARSDNERGVHRLRRMR